MHCDGVRVYSYFQDREIDDLWGLRSIYSNKSGNIVAGVQASQVEDIKGAMLNSSHDNLGCFPIVVVLKIILGAMSFDPLHALICSLLLIDPSIMLNLDTLCRCWFTCGSLRSKYLICQAPSISVEDARQSTRNIYDITATITCQEALPEHRSVTYSDIA